MFSNNVLEMMVADLAVRAIVQALVNGWEFAFCPWMTREVLALVDAIDDDGEFVAMIKQINAHPLTYPLADESAHTVPSWQEPRPEPVEGLVLPAGWGEQIVVSQVQPLHHLTQTRLEDLFQTGNLTTE